MGAIFKGSIPFSATPTTASTTTDGLMSAADKVKLESAMQSSNFWIGTQEEYDAIEEKSAETFYYITDTDDSGDLEEQVAAIKTTAEAAIPASEKASAGGVATLDSNKKLVQVPTAADIGISNRNLLDNWYFGNRTINQRKGYIIPAGETYFLQGSDTQAGTTSAAYKIVSIDSNGNGTFYIDGTAYWCLGASMSKGYCTSGYGFDRWICGGEVITFGTDCLHISSETRLGIDQKLEFPITGQYTYSIKFANNTGTVQIQTLNGDSSAWNNDTVESQASSGILKVTGSGTVGEVCFRVYYGSADIYSIKLELGPVSTLAYDSPPDYAAELLKCQRYYIQWDNSDNIATLGILPAHCVVYSSTVCQTVLITPVPMRSLPTSIEYKNLELQNAGTEITVTSITTYSCHANSIYFDIGASGLSAGTAQAFRFIRNANAYLCLSADL